WVFACLAIGSAVVFVIALAGLPQDPGTHGLTRARLSAVEHFQKADRLSGIAAAFLTSGGIVGLLTYIGVWLNSVHGVSVERIGVLFMFAGVGAVVASPFSGWLSDHAGKRTVIVFANIILAALFIVVARTNWGIGLVAGVAALSIAASARQAPLHALSTEIVGTEIRGEYIALRNAASQTGI